MGKRTPDETLERIEELEEKVDAFDDMLNRIAEAILNADEEDWDDDSEDD